MREPRKFTIKQLLTANSQFVIPRYQRGYDWKGDTQVKDLFTDLMQCLESRYDQDLFLGSMIFDVSAEKGDAKVEIIDGQQRFTTILITLVAARNFARDFLNNAQLALNIQNDIQNADIILGSSFNRLESSETIRDAFDIICEVDWTGEFPDHVIDEKTSKKRYIRRQVSRIEPIYKYAYGQILEICEEGGLPKFLEFMKQIQHRTYIIRIDVDDKSEAFEIFERTNARGKPLEVSDLLKNFLFSKEKELLDEEAEDVWEKISEDSGNNILRVLKYFWVSRRGAVVNRDLYRNLRGYSNEVGVNKFVRELQEFSQYYKSFYSGSRKDFPDWLGEAGFSKNSMYLSEISRSVAALRIFNITQPLPLIFSAFHSYFQQAETKRNPKGIINLVRYLESYHFINNKVCRRIGNEVERVYASFSDRLYNGDDFSETIENLISTLKDRTAGRDEFTASFSYFSYENITDRTMIRYIFDRLANIGIKAGQRIMLVDYFDAVDGIQSEYDIEHVLAQSSASDEDDFVHDIGNLLVVPKQINGILGSDDFKTKIAKLKTPHEHDNNIKNVAQYIYEFADYADKYDDWGKEEIAARTRHLAETVYQDSRFNYGYK